MSPGCRTSVSGSSFLAILVVRYNRKINEQGGLPGGPIVKNLPDNAGGMDDS